MPLDYVLTGRRDRTVGHIANPAEEESELLKNDIVARLLAGPQYQPEFTGIGGVYRGGSKYLQRPPVSPDAFNGSKVSSPDVNLSLDFTADRRFPSLGDTEP